MSDESKAALRSAVRTAAREESVSGEGAALRRAVETFRWLLDSASTPGEVAGARADLFAALQHSFGFFGERTVLDEAIELGVSVVRETPEGPRRAQQESNLSNALRLRFEYAGDPQDLVDAVHRARRGLDPTVPDEIQAQRWSNLGFVQRLRYEVFGREGDLDAAIGSFREALELAEEPGARQRRIRTNLGIALRLKGLATRDESLLHDAVRVSTAALSSSSSADPDRYGFVVNAGLAWGDLFEVGGNLGHLEEAITLLTEAVDLAWALDRPAALLNLAIARRVHAAMSPTYLDQAVETAVSAVVAHRSDSPDREIAWAVLGRAYWLRFEHRHDPTDGQRAVDCRLESARQIAGPARERATSGRLGGEWAMQLDEPVAALGGYGRAVELLPEVAWPGLDRSEQEFVLSEWNGLAENAAAAAVAARQVEQATVLVEFGRSVLWSRQLNRSTVDELAQVAPGLAEQLKDVRQRMYSMAARQRSARWSADGTRSQTPT